MTADEQDFLEPEWDDEMSGDYHDGRDQGEADARSGKPGDDRSGFKPATWVEGYRDGYEDIERRRAFRAGLRADAGKVTGNG